MSQRDLIPRPKPPSVKQEWARRRNWEIFAAKGNIALWKSFCIKHEIPFNAQHIEEYVINRIKRHYDEQR